MRPNFLLCLLLWRLCSAKRSHQSPATGLVQAIAPQPHAFPPMIKQPPLAHAACSCMLPCLKASHAAPFFALLAPLIKTTCCACCCGTFEALEDHTPITCRCPWPGYCTPAKRLSTHHQATTTCTCQTAAACCPAFMHHMQSPFLRCLCP